MNGIGALIKASPVPLLPCENTVKNTAVCEPGSELSPDLTKSGGTLILNLPASNAEKYTFVVQATLSMVFLLE